MIRKPGSVLADHLSSPDVAIKDRADDDESWREPYDEFISLQQTGFTFLQRHRCKLRAFTSLFSPLPRCFLHNEAVLFLWHFPWGDPRLLLATAFPFAARTFLLRKVSDQPIIWHAVYYNTYDKKE